MAKFKLIRSEHARSDEVIAEGDSLREVAEVAMAKSGSAGVDIGFSDDEFMDLGGDGGGLL